MAKRKKQIENLNGLIEVTLVGELFDPHQTNIIFINNRHVHFYKGKSLVDKVTAEELAKRGFIYGLSDD